MKQTDLQLLQIVLLDVLRDIVDLQMTNHDGIKKKNHEKLLIQGQSEPMSHLNRAGHGAQSKDGGAILHCGLVIERSLSVHQKHSHLQQRHTR